MHQWSCAAGARLWVHRGIEGHRDASYLGRGAQSRWTLHVLTLPSLMGFAASVSSLSTYRCCIQTQVDDLLLAQVWLCCTLIVTATVIPRTHEAPAKVQSLYCFSPANMFTVHFQRKRALFICRGLCVPSLYGDRSARSFPQYFHLVCCVLWPRPLLLLSEALSDAGDILLQRSAAWH